MCVCQCSVRNYQQMESWVHRCWADGKLCSSVLETVHWSLGGAAAYRGAVVGPTVHVGGQMIGQCV